MEYVYWQSEPGLWTVGCIGSDNKREPESDHESKDSAAERVRYLNGGEIAKESEGSIEFLPAIHTLRQNIRASYTALTEATRKLHINTQIEIASRDGYEKAKAALLLAHADNPKELGANEEARNAAIKVKLWEECATLSGAAELVANSRYELTVAQLAVDSLRAQLRCFEVIAALGRAE